MKTPVLLFCAAMALGPQANADVVIDIIEFGGNVIATLSGDFDLDATQGFAGNSVGINGFRASTGLNSMSTEVSELYGMDVQWTPFGTGDFGFWDASKGDSWHMFSNPLLGVPPGYVSGTALSASATKVNSSFAEMGFTPGTYVTTLTNGDVTDTVTVIVGGYQLRVRGTCPGQMTIQWSGGIPNSRQGIALGLNRGSTTFPQMFPCAGTVLGISGRVQLLDPPGLFNNQGGRGSISGKAGTLFCRHYLQLVEARTCRTSNVVQIP